MTQWATTVAVATAAVMSAAGVSAASQMPKPARALVFADEFRLTASRESVPAGLLHLQLRNIGEDDHDLVVRRRGGTKRLATTGVVRPGATGALRISLSPGRYVLFCSISNHAPRGMRTQLVVGALKPGQS